MQRASAFADAHFVLSKYRKYRLANLEHKWYVVIGNSLKRLKKKGEKCEVNRKPHTRWLPFLLALLLVVESIGGNVITAKAADVSKIQTTVVDNKGNSMPGIECQLIDASASNEIIDTIISDADGKVEYAVNGLQNGEYRLKIPFTGTYTCKPTNGYVYRVADGKVVSVDSKEYTGEEKFVLTSINDVEQDELKPDQETLIINVTDSEGKPFNEKVFVVVDSEFPNQEGVKKAPQNGKLKVTVDSNMKSGEIRVANSLSGQYAATPQKIEFTANNKAFTTVNGEAYDGTKTFSMEIVVDESQVEDKGKITSLTLDKNTLPAEGGDITVEIAGEKLLSNVNLNVYQTTSSEELSGVNVLNTDTLQKYTISVPANTSKESQIYMVACSIKGDLLSTRTLEFTVEGKKDDVQEDTSSTAVIDSAEVTPAQVSNEGGEVTLKISGTGLTANNWDIRTEVYIYTDVNMTDRYGKVVVKDKTAEGATLVIPANALKNDAEYHIGVGPTKGSSVSVQKTVKVLQSAKEATVSVNPKQVELASSNTIVATMEENVVFGYEDVEVVKSKIYIADHSSSSNKVNLTANDTVTIEENKITIEFEEMPELKTTSALYVEEGAFRRESDNVNLKAFSWLIYSNPTITGIQIDDEILEHTGGIVTGTIKGVRLSEAPVITAKIFKAATSTATEIPVTIGSGDNPSITFDVPANHSQRTESYIINLTMGNTPVYVEGVVSVLPEGESDTTQTLSAMTISGNNKISNNDNSTEIVVKVSPQVGELKTRLNLYGTNLDSTKTEVRAIDQNGVYWKVTHIPE